MQEFCGENCNPIDKTGDFGHAYGIEGIQERRRRMC